jgi:hypothetical protein
MNEPKIKSIAPTLFVENVPKPFVKNVITEINERRGRGLANDKSTGDAATLLDDILF